MTEFTVSRSRKSYHSSSSSSPIAGAASSGTRDDIVRATAMSAHCLESKFEDCEDGATMASAVNAVSLAEAARERAGLEEAAAFGKAVADARSPNRRNAARAVSVLRPLAERGEPLPQTILAGLYARGHGTEQNLAEAAKLYRAAAGKGIVEGGQLVAIEQLRCAQVPGIVGAGAACERAQRNRQKRVETTRRLQQRLWEGLRTRVPFVKLNGPVPGPDRLPAALNVSFEFVEGEGLMLLCDVNGIAVSSGTSCVSKALKISPVLSAIRLDESLAQGSITMSLGKDNTEEEIAYVVETFVKMVNKLRAMAPRWDEFQRGVIDSIICPKGRDKSLANV
jgi:hypothetical protein